MSINFKKYGPKWTRVVLVLVIILGALGISHLNSKFIKKNDNLPIIIGAAASGYPPLQYHDEKNNFVGYDVDFFNEVAKLIGVRIQWIHPRYDGVFLAVQTEKADFAPGFVATVERRKKVDFSDAYHQGNYSTIITNSESGNSIETIKEPGKTIAVVSGSFQEDLLDKLYPHLKKVYFAGNEHIGENVIYNKVDFGILPYSNALTLAKLDRAQGRLSLIGEVIPDSGARVVVKIGNEELKKKLNEAIKTLRSNGTQEFLYKKWYKDTPYRSDFGEE
jgi:polar amino acid transport system substrate-binding protein